MSCDLGCGDVGEWNAVSTQRGFDILLHQPVVAQGSRAHLMPPGIPHHLLRMLSVPEYLQGQTRPAPDALIDVASSSPEILQVSTPRPWNFATHVRPAGGAA